jgi:acyl carrier protein
MKGYEEILAVLYERLKPSVKAGRKLEEDTDLVADLGLDSLKVMTLVEEVEDYFDISIPLTNSSILLRPSKNWRKVESTPSM